MYRTLERSKTLYPRASKSRAVGIRFEGFKKTNRLLCLHLPQTCPRLRVHVGGVRCDIPIRPGANLFCLVCLDGHYLRSSFGSIRPISARFTGMERPSRDEARDTEPMEIWQWITLQSVILAAQVGSGNIYEWVGPSRVRRQQQQQQQLQHPALTVCSAVGVFLRLARSANFAPITILMSDWSRQNRTATKHHPSRERKAQALSVLWAMYILYFDLR